MKRLNVLLLSVMALGMTVVSCSKDENKDENASGALSGKFVFDKVTETKAGETSEPTDYNNPNCSDMRYYDFKSGGKVEDGYVGALKEGDDACKFTKFSSTWTQNGDVIKVVGSDGFTEQYTLVSMTSNVMTVKAFDAQDATHFYTITLNKK